MFQKSIREIGAADTWPVRQRVMWPDKDLDFVKLEDDHQGIHYGLFAGDTLVSVISLFPEGDKARFRKFATEKAFQGKGYGTELLSHLIAEARRLGVSHLSCSARVTAAPFYHRFGMKECSDEYGAGEIKYVKMEINL